MNERLTRNSIPSAIERSSPSLVLDDYEKSAATAGSDTALGGLAVPQTRSGSAAATRTGRFLGAALRRLLRCPPYRLHCQSGTAEIVTDLPTVPGAMCQAYSLLVKEAAEPLWIEGPWGQTAMSARQLDDALRLMYLSERWTSKGKRA